MNKLIDNKVQEGDNLNSKFEVASSLFGKGGLLEPKDEWDKLSIAAKAEMMKVAVNHGIYDLQTIRQKYNEFAEGGNLLEGGGSTVVTDDLVDWTIKEEGFNRQPEDIGDGKITLGSGLTAKRWHDLYKKRGNKWSDADNRMAVRQELSEREAWARNNIPNWEGLPDSSKEALLLYKYNYDFNQANSPKLFAALAAGNLQEAAKQMDATSKNPKFRKGLQARRKREQERFLSDVPSSPITPISIFEQPVSTAVYNPYIQQAGNTRIAPIMVPDDDSYITTHKLTESEERRKKLQESVEAFNNFKKLMQMTSVNNTATPAFMPTTGNTFLDDIMGLTKAKGGKIYIKPSHRGKLTELKKRTGKTEAELYNDGNPAHKKMVVFARNSRRWKHGLGGNLFAPGGNTKASDYRYVLDDDGEWNRVANDEIGRVFQGLTVTPKKTKQKFIPERIDNSLEAAKARDKFFQYRDEEGHIKGEPGLEIVSPEFEVLMGARMAMPTYSQEATRNYKIAKSFKADTKRMPSVNSAFRNEEWENFLLTRNGDNYYRLTRSPERATKLYDEGYFVSHTTPWEEFTSLRGGVLEEFNGLRGVTYPNSRKYLYEFPTETFGNLNSTNAEGVVQNLDVTKLGKQHLLYGNSSTRKVGPIISKDTYPIRFGNVDRPLKHGVYDKMPVYEKYGMGNQTVVTGGELNNALDNTVYNIFSYEPFFLSENVSPFGITKTIHVK